MNLYFSHISCSLSFGFKDTQPHISSSRQLLFYSALDQWSPTPGLRTGGLFGSRLYRNNKQLTLFIFNPFFPFRKTKILSSVRTRDICIMREKCQPLRHCVVTFKCVACFPPHHKDLPMKTMSDIKLVSGEHRLGTATLDSKHSPIVVCFLCQNQLAKK